jgi:hypothetical protein
MLEDSDPGSLSGNMFRIFYSPKGENIRSTPVFPPELVSEFARLSVSREVQ